MRQSELVALNIGRNNLPKGVNRVLRKDKNGAVTWVAHYHRKGGQIHGEPGSDEFNENYLKLKSTRYLSQMAACMVLLQNT